MPEVRAATAADVPAIGRVLAAAFDGDPVWSHLASPKADWSTAAGAWFAAEAKAQIAGHGEAYVDTEGRGAAIWAPPGHWKGTAREALAVALPSIRLFRGGLFRAMGNLRTMERLHPNDQDHWYLAILGTDPAHQGAGVGSALIRRITERCDAEGLGAYLESSKEQNVPFYARHGFQVREEIQMGGGPKMWLMWRDPSG